MSVIFIAFLMILFMAVGLGLIPATIAKNKGYNFWLWWLYGFFLWLVAVIHACVLPNKYALQQQPPYNNPMPPYAPPYSQSAADEIKKYKELYDRGVITEEEFQAKKRQLLNLM